MQRWPDIYTTVKFEEPYDAKLAFKGPELAAAPEQQLADLRAGLDERFEVLDRHLCQVDA